MMTKQEIITWSIIIFGVAAVAFVHFTFDIKWYVSLSLVAVSLLLYVLYYNTVNKVPDAVQPENIPGECRRCLGEIPPFHNVCILGADPEKHSVPREFITEIICSRCTDELHFDINGTHVTNNLSQLMRFMPQELFEKSKSP